MPLLRVVGSPTPPSGKILTSSTRLVILYMYAYSDSDELYPIRYDASYDAINNRWKPLGTPDGTILYVPGPEADEAQDFYRDNVIIHETELGQWNYSATQEPSIVSLTVEVAWIRLQVPLGV
ncbi:MAG: hypothetical protein LC650_04595 [Actinobacteria bacterium]|nr:hypothetical protein [Actinomycetota bacterium]